MRHEDIFFLKRRLADHTFSKGELITQPFLLFVGVTADEPEAIILFSDIYGADIGAKILAKMSDNAGCKAKNIQFALHRFMQGRLTGSLPIYILELLT